MILSIDAFFLNLGQILIESKNKNTIKNIKVILGLIYEKDIYVGISYK